MALHDRFGLSKVINAAGSFTPLGVSRSSDGVGRATAEALSQFFVIDELQDAVSRALAEFSGAEAGAVTHCVSAGITVSVAAAMAGTDAQRVAALPSTQGMPSRVVLPAGHAINYGHPLEQDVRLAGAQVVLAGNAGECSADDIRLALDHRDSACLLLVSSRLVHGKAVDLKSAVAEAHRHGVPAIIDGAAQDMRIGELIETGADLVLVSAHKYLASPTAGLVIGRRELVKAVRAQEKGIGRGMKPSKEAILGVLAAIEERQGSDLAAWRRREARKVEEFVLRANELPGVRAHAEADPAGMPFSRAYLRIEEEKTPLDAKDLARALKSGSPSIWVMEHGLADAQLILELVQVNESELDILLRRLSGLLD